MSNISPSQIIHYISEEKCLLVGRNNQPNQQLLKFDYKLNSTFKFQIINKINQIITPDADQYELFGSFVDNKQNLHILFYTKIAASSIVDNTLVFDVDSYTSEYLNNVKTQKQIDVSIVAIKNNVEKSMILRDIGLAYPRPYVAGRTPIEIVNHNIFMNLNSPVSGSLNVGNGFGDIAVDINNFSFGEGLYTNTENQLVIGQYNVPSATTNQAFVIGNGTSDSQRSNAFTVDYEGNVQAGAISATSLTVDGEQVATDSDLTDMATKTWVNEQGFLTEHQSLDGFATEQWVLDKGYITGVNLDPYATKDQLTAYATKSDLTVSASILSNQISQLALNIPTKVSDLTNDAGYLTAVPTSYALKTDIPTGNAQLQNTAGYITGYNAGTGISISNGTISLTGEVGKTYYADNNTLQLNNNTNTFSIKSLSSKLNQGQNILLTPQSDGSVTINAIGGGGGGTGGATYLAGLGLSLSTVSAEDGIYKFYVNEPWLDNKINTATSGIQNLSAGTGLEIEDNVISLTAEIPSIDGLASEQWVETNFLSAIPSNYATKDYVDSSVSGKADLSSVYTKEEVYTYIETDAKINEATSGKADLSAVQAVDDKFDNYYTSAQVDQAIATAVEDIPSTVYTGTDGIKVENGVISLTATLSSITNDAGFITSADIPTSYVQQSELESVSGQLTNAIGAKANTTDVEAEFTATSAWANETFLTEHQSLDNYYNKTEVDTALALKADSADVYTKIEVNNISTNIVSQIPTDVATSAYVQAASGNAVSVATGWVEDKNYLSSINVIQQDTDFDENTSKLFFNTGFSLAQTEDMVRVDIDTNSIATQEYVTDQVSGKADQSTVESLSTALSTAIDTKANSADVYTKSQVYTKGEVDTAINTATSGKVNKTDFDTVTGALSTAIDSKVTSGEVKTQIEAYGYQNATDVANAISGKADKSELQSVSGTLNTAIGGVSDRVGAIEADYTTSAQVSNIVTGYDYISAITVVNEYQQFEENTKKLTFDTGFGLTQSEDTVRIELDVNYVATVDALSSVSGTLTGQISAVDTKATNNTNSINALTGRVKAIEDDYTTSAYVTGQVNNLATGAVATNTANITQLSTKLDTVSSSVPTSVYQIATAGSGITISEQGEIALIWNTIPSAVSQLINDVGFVTEAGGGGTGIEYYGGYGISVNGAEISLTADIPTNTNQLTNGAGFISAIALWFDGESEAQNVTDITFTSDFTWNSGDIGINAQGIIAANEIATESYVDGQVSGKADQSTVETLSTNLSAAITGVANDIPLSTSQLTNDSGFITASDIPAAPSTVYDKLSAGSNITLTKNDSTGVTTIAATGGGGGGASTISVTVEDRSTEQLITAPASSVYFSENGFNGVISNNVAQIQWKGIFSLDSNEELIDYEKGIQWSEDFSVGTSEDHFTVSLTNPIPTNVSDLTNDSGYQTAAQVSAIASAYAQGGGGTTYTAGTGISISNDEISVDQTWFENSVSSLVSSDMDAAASAAVESYIELSGLATGTGLFYDDTDNSLNINLSADANSNMVVSADNNGVVWLSAAEGGSTYTAGDGIDITNDEISVKLSGGDNVTLSTDSTGLITINATGGGSGGGSEQTNQQTISTGFTYDSKLEIAKNTYTPTDGVVTLSAFNVPAGSLDSNKVATFEEWVYANDTLTGITFDGVTLTNELPSEISQKKYYVFTRRILGNGDQFISFNYEGINQLFIPLTFKAVRGPTTIGMNYSNGFGMQYSISYSLDNGETWQTLNSPSNKINLNQNQTVMFSGNNTTYTWNSGSSYQFFVTTGYFQAYGNVMSLLKNKTLGNVYSLAHIFKNCSGMVKAPLLPASTLTNYCYAYMFQGCTSLTAAPQLPATTLADGCYHSMFGYCTSLTDAPELPATGLADGCYQSMFYNCPSLTDAPALPATTLASQCYSWMFGNTSVSNINVSFTSWHTNGTIEWLYNTSTNGTFTCPTALGTDQTITRGTSNCPTNWTVVNK